MTNIDFGLDAGDHARERARSTITHLVHDTAGSDAFREVPIVPGGRTTEHRPEPLHGLRAALRLRSLVTEHAKKFVEELRADGASWPTVAAEVRGDDLDAADVEAVFAEFAVHGLSRFDASWLSWHCSSCGARVMDYGPNNGHPDDIEHGHADTCARHASEVRAYEQDSTDQDGLDEQGLLERTGGWLAECEGCGEPIPASFGYGGLCGSCEQYNG